jgi:hypothetical protein
VLTAAVGVALIFLSNTLVVPLSIGTGVVAYAIAVALYTLLAVWRLRRVPRGVSQRLPAAPAILVNGASFKSQLTDSCACETSDFPGK